MCRYKMARARRHRKGVQENVGGHNRPDFGGLFPASDPLAQAIVRESQPVRRFSLRDIPQFEDRLRVKIRMPNFNIPVSPNRPTRLLGDIETATVTRDPF